MVPSLPHPALANTPVRPGFYLYFPNQPRGWLSAERKGNKIYGYWWEDQPFYAYGFKTEENARKFGQKIAKNRDFRVICVK